MEYLNDQTIMWKIHFLMSYFIVYLLHGLFQNIYVHSKKISKQKFELN